MKKKLLGVLLATSMVLGLTACGSSSAPAADAPADSAAKTEAAGDAAAGDWTWERKIEIVCPWGAGGGADTTVRQFATALEKELGVSVVINNKSGAGGVSGVEYAISQPADGYTWLLNTPSTMLAQISGATETDVYGSITPVCNLVHDQNIFVTAASSPFNTYEEMMKYIEENPDSAKCGVMSITGLDNACVIGTFGDKVESVAYSEGAQLNSDIIGGHVLLACVGPAEVSAMIASGDMKPILSCTEERLTMAGFENVECTGELGIDCYYGPYRGIFAANGTPEAAMTSFAAAAEKAVASEEFQKWAVTEGLDQRQGWYNTADFQAMWDQDFKDLTEVFGQ
ncbi:MAG: tripartite tricarboxylate transporter substrate binding protein [Lachnospiraceae bacterium]|nr:tripartite tricarboxylate transporter substrate binding protein [Lachnospiraceae bacterium]